MVTLDLNPNHEGSFDHRFSFTLYNAYFRKNYFAINSNKTVTENDDFVIPSNHWTQNDFVPTGKYLLGTIPSVKYILTW